MTETTAQIVLIAARAAYAALKSNAYDSRTHPSHVATEALEFADRAVKDAYMPCDTYGVTGFAFGEYGGSYNEGLTYLNTGDAYTRTVMFDSRDETFSVGTYGDFIESLESENAEEEDDTDDSEDELTESDLVAPQYAVTVGNLGDVWDGSDHATALSTYEAYRVQSMEGYGRVGGEPVTLWDGGEPSLEYDPTA